MGQSLYPTTYVFCRTEMPRHAETTHNGHNKPLGVTHSEGKYAILKLILQTKFCEWGKKKEIILNGILGCSKEIEDKL